MLKFSSAANRTRPSYHSRKLLLSSRDGKPSLSRQETRAEPLGIALSGFDERAELLALSLPTLEIVVDLFPVLKVVADRRIDVGQHEGGIAVNDLFRRRPLLEGADDKVQEDPSPADPHGAMLVHPQGDGIGCDGKGELLLAHRYDYTG